MCGHEIIGRVTAVGSAIEHVKVGARAGVGWQSAACHNCEWCLRGDEAALRRGQVHVLRGQPRRLRRLHPP